MLDQLVESKSNSKENKRRTEFVVVVAAIAIASLLTMWTVSLFGQNFDMGGDDLSLAQLVAPVIADEEPPPKVEKQEKQPEADTRTELIQNMDQTPVKPPDVISAEKSKIPPIDPNKITVLGKSNTFTGADLGSNAGRVGGESGTGTLASTATDAPKTNEGDDAPPPPKLKPKIVSGGVLNGKATSLPKPAYPAAAKAIHASGSVVVQVTIDEGGRVISASAVSGHPLLRAAAVSAAQGARFSPTLLSGQPVKVSGIRRDHVQFRGAIGRIILSTQFISRSY